MLWQAAEKRAGGDLFFRSAVKGLRISRRETSPLLRRPLWVAVSGTAMSRSPLFPFAKALEIVEPRPM